MKKKGIVVFILIIVIALIIALSSFLIVSFKNLESSLENYFDEEPKIEKSSNGYIARVNLNGIISEENETYNQAWLLSIIENLKKDKKNVALALVINSPGGSVYQADEVFFALKDYKSCGKPVYVYMTEMAASGGYYISCVADKIYANRNTLTGSIGVIMGQSFDATEFLSKIGIKSTTIHSGKNKNMMNFNEPFTAEQKKIMQDICDECYEQFTGLVADSRNIPVDFVKVLADGRIMTAKQALKEKLIDKISSFDEMIKDLEKSELDGKRHKIRNFEYEPEFSLIDYFVGKFTSSAVSKKFSSFAAEATLRYPAFLYKN